MYRQASILFYFLARTWAQSAASHIKALALKHRRPAVCHDVPRHSLCPITAPSVFQALGALCGCSFLASEKGLQGASDLGQQGASKPFRPTFVTNFCCAPPTPRPVQALPCGTPLQMAALSEVRGGGSHPTLSSSLHPFPGHPRCQGKPQPLSGSLQHP